tara:strand:+ start:102 stop:275 length:174 start_codon:yes stop_codon:yes gene_type:complete
MTIESIVVPGVLIACRTQSVAELAAAEIKAKLGRRLIFPFNVRRRGDAYVVDCFAWF